MHTGEIFKSIWLCRVSVASKDNRTLWMTLVGVELGQCWVLSSHKPWFVLQIVWKNEVLIAWTQWSSCHS